MLARKLEQLLKRDAKTQKDLAFYLGISAQAVGKYLKGRSDPTPANIVKIADYFHVTTDYLLKESSKLTTKDKIIRFMEELGYNYKDLADDIGEPRKLILDIIEGNIEIPKHVLESISQKYSISEKTFATDNESVETELEKFCLDPSNKEYIECAMRLKHARRDPKKIVDFIESLQNI